MIERTGERNSDMVFSAMHRYGTDASFFMFDIDCLEVDFEEETQLVRFLAAYDVKQIPPDITDPSSWISNKLDGSSSRVYYSLGLNLKVPVFVLFFQISSGMFVCVSLNNKSDEKFRNISQLSNEFTLADSIFNGHNMLSFKETEFVTMQYKHPKRDKDILQVNKPFLSILNRFLETIRQQNG